MSDEDDDLTDLPVASHIELENCPPECARACPRGREKGRHRRGAAAAGRGAAGMIFGSLPQTRAVWRHNELLKAQHLAMMHARAAAMQEKYGEAFAGLDAQGHAILWRESPIPNVPRRPWGQR